MTANLLAAAAATPLIGRFADLHNKKHVLLVVLVVVLVGLGPGRDDVIAAAVDRGAGAAGRLVLAVPDLRGDPARRTTRGAGGAIAGRAVGHAGLRRRVGLVVTGLLMNGTAGYHRVFWLTTVFTVLVIVVVLVCRAVPRAHRRGHASTGWARWASRSD